MLKIVIVDDESPIREWLEYVIAQKQEFQIVGSCRSAKDALDLIEKKSPNVLITDIEMPGMNGLELISFVKETNPHMKFVLLTNYADFTYAKEAIRLGTLEYLLKSSLQASDVVALLLKIEEELKQAAIREQADEWFAKKITLSKEVMTDGRENEIKVILRRAGVSTSGYFQVFTMVENDLVEQIKNIRRASLETNLSYHYFQSQGYLYVIGQSEQKGVLQKKLAYVIQEYSKLSADFVGVSKAYSTLDVFLMAVRQSRVAILNGFYQPEQRIMYLENLKDGFKLNRKEIRNRYLELIFFLSEGKYESLIDEVEKWYAFFDLVPSDDMMWGIDICRNLAMAFEEKKFRENEKWEAKIGKLDQLASVKACQSICIDALEKLLKNKQSKYSERMEAAMNYVHQNFNRDLSLVEVAEYLHITPEYFSRLFKEEVGSSFTTYLITHRLKKAEYLLRKTNLSVAEIAEQVGYEQASYFSRIYKKYRGITPLKTREFENKK
ncbi:response regulator transcription factor [Gottschalkiaceae bacterium SANA]|nr:response regulator transcription factor [Gottschalkiaceae bacterium SANA]